MKRSALCIGLVVAVLVALSGCNKGGDPLTGKWKLSAKDMPAGVEMTTEFIAPDQIVQSGSQGGMMTIRLEGTYKLVGEKLTIDPKSIKLSLTPEALAKIPEAARKQAEEQVKAGEAQALEVAKKNTEATIKWDGPDKFTATDAKGSAEVFTRVK